MCMKVVQRLRIDKFDSKTRKRFIRFTLENLKASKEKILGKQSILDAMDDALKRNKIQWTSATITAAYALWKKYFAEPLVKAGAMAEQVPGKKGVSLKAPYTFILDEGELISVFYPPTKEEKVEKPDETEPASSVEETPSPVVEEENAEKEEKADNTDATPQKQEEVSEGAAIEETLNLDEMTKKADALVYILGKMEVKKKEKTVAFPIEEIAKILEVNNETDRKALRKEVYRALFELKTWGEQFGIFLNMKNLNGRTEKQKDVIRFTNDPRNANSLAKAGQLKKELEAKMAGVEKPEEDNTTETSTATAVEVTKQTTKSLKTKIGITIEVIDDLKSAKPLAETIKEEGVSCSFKDNFVFISPEESRNFLIKLGWEIRILQFIKNLKYSK